VGFETVVCLFVGSTICLHLVSNHRRKKKM
jgi:hypothetical protein